jgi:hypothetical protein
MSINFKVVENVRIHTIMPVIAYPVSKSSFRPLV